MRIFVGIAIIFILGTVVGRATTTPEVDYVEGPTKTITVTEPAPEPIEISVVPDACIDMARYAKTIAENADQMYDRGSEQLAILSDARMALAGGTDTAPANNAQRKLTNDMNGNLARLSEAVYQFDRVYEDCENSK